jgi:hypothetical protein
MGLDLAVLKARRYTRQSPASSRLQNPIRADWRHCAIDHGFGLKILLLSRLDVKVGEHIERGQVSALPVRPGRASDRMCIGASTARRAPRSALLPNRRVGGAMQAAEQSAGTIESLVIREIGCRLRSVLAGLPRCRAAETPIAIR